MPKIIKKILKNSTIIIGHAYGSHSTQPIRGKKAFLAPKISLFLENNRELISTVVFSGDVMSLPTEEKWKLLYTTYKKDFDIFIAPGNHDVLYSLNNLRRDIFNISTKDHQPNSYPFYFSRNGFNIVIDDSSRGFYFQKIWSLLVKIDLIKEL